MQNSRDENKEKKHTTTKLIICIIIIIIIILLLITSCTSSFWGKIGSVFGHTNVVVDNNTNDKRENINKNLFFNVQEDTITLDDSSYKLTYSYKDILPEDVVCTTSDAEIATCVAYDGYVVVNPKRAGKVIIYATSATNDVIYKATCDLTINNGKNGIKMSSTAGEIVLANTNKKNVSYNLVGIKGKIKVTVDDESIATATAKDGVLSIKGLKPGTTKITLTIEYGGKTYTAEYTITVSQNKESTTKKPSTTKKNNSSELKLNVSFKQLYVKDTYQIKVLSGKAIKWESTNKKVVTVNSKGKITAKGVGTAEINAYDANGNKATVKVTVVAKPKPSKLQLSTTYKVLKVGETFTPDVIKGKASRWKSSNSKIATVDKKTGKIIAKSPGTVTITASDFWYFGNKATITIVVEDVSTPVNPTQPVKPTQPTNPTNPTNPSQPTGPTDPTKPADLVLGESNVSLVVNDTYKINVTQGTAIKFESDNPNIAYVDSNGNITAVSPGTVKITVTGQNGEKKVVTVTVTANSRPDDLDITETKVTLKPGEKHTITVNHGKAEKFESKDPNVATVDSNGKITAKNPGTTTIVVTGQNGEKVEITVVVKPSDITPDPSVNVEFVESSKTLTVGDVYIPDVKGAPIKFESSDPGVATVDPKTGVITAVKAGETTITVTDANGNTSSMKITVKDPASDPNIYLELSTSNIEMTVGDIEKIRVKQGTPISYESSNSDIVTVTSDGRLEAKKPGVVTITVTGAYGEKRTITVTVKSENVPVNPDKELIVSPTEKIMTVGDEKNLSDFIKQGTVISATSSNNSVVEIVNGKLIAKGKGEAIITVNGKLNSQTIKIIVEEEPIVLSRPTLDLVVGEKGSVTVLQGKVDHWESSDPSIATVNPKTGEITAVKEGKVTIWAVSESGEKTPVQVTVSNSSNNKLGNLQVFIGNEEQNIAFNPDTTSYEIGPISSDINLNKYSIVATPANNNATVTYKLEDGSTPNPCENQDLHVGNNIVTVIVTAQNGDVNTYVVNIIKESSKNTAFDLFTKDDSLINPDEKYFVGYDNKKADLHATLKDSRSEFTEVTINGNSVSFTQNADGTVDIDESTLKPGDNTITIKVKSESGEIDTYTYVIYRAKRTINLDETSIEFDIEDKQYTLNYTIEEEIDVDGNKKTLAEGDYDPENEITFTKHGFNGSVSASHDIITVTPTRDDIGLTSTIDVSYNGESEETLTVKVTKEEYKITGPKNYEAYYNEDLKTVAIKFDTNILKYVGNNPDEPLYGEPIQNDNGFCVKSTNGDDGLVCVSYDKSIVNIELKKEDKATTSYILEVTMKKPEAFSIDVSGSIYGETVTPLHIDVVVKQKYVVTLRISDEDKEGYLSPIEDKERKIPLDSGTVYDLSVFEPFKVADKENCLVFEFLHWIDQKTGAEIAQDATITVDRNYDLVAVFDDESKKGEYYTTGHLSLKSLDLFDSVENNYKEISNKLIYPGLSGGHTFTIENTTDGDLTINKIIMEEETLCVENNICLNMGYRVKRIIPDSLNDVYYYGSSSLYQILNKETNYGAGTKEIPVTDDFVIAPGDVAELTVLWQWVDDDANDYKIGEKANENSSYQFYIGVDFTKTNPTCDIPEDGTRN